MQLIFGILMTFIGAASGLLFQDPVVCRFNVSDQCYVAQGQRLHLKIPLVDGFNLDMTDKTSKNISILRFRKIQSNPPKPNRTTWQFNTENYTMILTSAESSDSGTYYLDTFNAGGTATGKFTLQLHIEAEVSSVSVTYSCSASEDIKVYCSAHGDNLTYSWTPDFNILSQLENGTNTQTLSKEYQGNVTCYVKNHVSQNQNSTVLYPCPKPTTAATTPNVTKETYDYIMILLGVFCVLIILIFIAVFCVYRKNEVKKTQAAPPPGDRELEYTEVNHMRQNRSDPRTMTSPVQDDNVEYATVAIQGGKRSAKKKKTTEDEVQYGELVFGAPARSKHNEPNVQDDCVYSQVHHGR